MSIQVIIFLAEEGDLLVLKTQQENKDNVMNLYTLWGDFIGVFDVRKQIPDAWTTPDRIEVTIAEIKQRSKGLTLLVKIDEV